MNNALETLARSIGLHDPAAEPLRLAFALECVQRVEQYLELPEARECLAGLKGRLAGHLARRDLGVLAQRAAALAGSHRGSASIDGAGHAAVSATYALAKAMAGLAVEAAGYAAYAAVYGQGGYGAVADPDSFAPEWAWQVDRLRQLAQARNGAKPALAA